MKSITILSDFYYPSPLANGICAHEVAKEFVKNDYSVSVVCFSVSNPYCTHQLIDGVDVHYVKARLFHRIRKYGENHSDSFSGNLIYRLSILLHRFKTILFLPLYPLSSPLFAYKYYKKALGVVIDTKSEILLSVYNPIEALCAGFFVKKKINDLNWIVYNLDSLSNKFKKKSVLKNILDYMGELWEYRFFNTASSIFNMKTHESHYSQSKFNAFNDKMYISDIPLFIPQSIYHDSLNIKSQSSTIKFIYTGALDSNMRNPRYFCELFVEYAKFHNVEMSFYSRGNCENMLSEFSEISNNSIKQLGYVAPHVIRENRNISDFLVSIGNRNTDLVPSKIFEYISTGKPIIHLYKGDDSALKYLSCYPLALMINEDDDFNLNLSKLEDFALLRNKLVDPNQLISIYKHNMPSYLIKLIEGEDC